MKHATSMRGSALGSAATCHTRTLGRRVQRRSRGWWWVTLEKRAQRTDRNCETRMRDATHESSSVGNTHGCTQTQSLRRLRMRNRIAGYRKYPKPRKRSLKPRILGVTRWEGGHGPSGVRVRCTPPPQRNQARGPSEVAQLTPTQPPSPTSRGEKTNLAGR